VNFQLPTLKLAAGQLPVRGHDCHLPKLFQFCTYDSSSTHSSFIVNFAPSLPIRKLCGQGSPFSRWQLFSCTQLFAHSRKRKSLRRFRSGPATLSRHGQCCLPSLEYTWRQQNPSALRRTLPRQRVPFGGPAARGSLWASSARQRRSPTQKPLSTSSVRIRSPFTSQTRSRVHS
jgi:hypothetical protein